jgi:rod shape-determining protein MreD
MMPRASETLLLPVNPWFMWGSLLAAGLINMVPLGRSAWIPDILALTLVFWNIHQPKRMGMGVGFLLGVMIDVHEGALLGQHALAYTLLSFLSLMIHRRLMWFDSASQAAHMLPLFFFAHLIELGVRLKTGSSFPGWSYFLAPLLEAALWPVISTLLLAPQRRPPDQDDHRPL